MRQITDQFFLKRHAPSNRGSLHLNTYAGGICTRAKRSFQVARALLPAAQRSAFSRRLGAQHS